MLWRHRLPILHKSFLLRRTYAAATSTPRALLFIEHSNGNIESGTLSALTAASVLGGEVTGVIVGDEKSVGDVVGKAKRLKGLSKIIHSSSPSFTHPLPEHITPFLHNLLTQNPDHKSKYTHIVSAHSSLSKAILPRLAAILDTPAVSDITSLSHDPSSNSTTFTRPIYAGNAIAHVKAPENIQLKFFTVRPTAFTAAEEDGNGDIETESIAHNEISDSPTEHIKTQLTSSDRPELGAASRVVSGGRALKNAETFKKTIEPLADALGAAIGASRAAVDAGYVDNSLQVGQTGKVVAPELYVAVGISGAIQHLAGMKDSKLIVAINKDADAPIFQVADAGLVADLYEAVPELVEKLKQ